MNLSTNLFTKLKDPQLRNDIGIAFTIIGTLVSISCPFGLEMGTVLWGIAITCLFIGLVILIIGRMKSHSPYTPWTPVVPPQFVDRRSQVGWATRTN